MKQQEEEDNCSEDDVGAHEEQLQDTDIVEDILDSEDTEEEDIQAVEGSLELCKVKHLVQQVLPLVLPLVLLLVLLLVQLLVEMQQGEVQNMVALQGEHN